jgi:excisionase family DNA binding protein
LICARPNALSFFSNYHGYVTVTTEHTVFPAAADRGLAALLVALRTSTTLAIETTDGQSFPLTPELRDVLTHAAHALIEGQAVTLEPQRVILSTQEAADLLGVSRPTLVKLLEAGAIPYTQPGRHRRVQLTDLLAYQRQIRHQRRNTLAAMNAEAAADDAYGRFGEFGETR